MARTMWSVLAIVVMLGGCGAPPADDGSSETNAIHAEGYESGEDGSVADEDFDAGNTGEMAMGDEPADDQGADSR